MQPALDTTHIAARPWRRHRRRTAPRGRSGATRSLRAQRRQAMPRPAHADRHRPQHGRQIHLHAANRADRLTGALRRLRTGGQRPHRPAGSHLHPHRRRRRPSQRTLHLHGGDDRNRRHPQQRHRRQPGADGRSGARHQHLRRPIAGLGRRRPPSARQPRHGPVRHPLFRDDGPGNTA